MRRSGAAPNVTGVREGARRWRWLVGGTACGLLLVAAAATPASGQAAKGADRDCSDFATQAEAQAFFISRGGPGSDPHRLDFDGDGRACEYLPCPCSSQGARPVAGGKTAKPKRLRGRVVRVVDGDTIDVRLARGKRRRVRLLGIDTPEVYGGRECGGRLASVAMRRLAQGRRVKLVTDTTQDRRDRYGRLLAYVRRAGGAWLQLKMLRAGWARTFVYQGNPFRRVRSFRAVERGARRADRGIWGRCER